MKYTQRITDSILNDRLSTFGGVLITGPKGCGKTTSAKQFAKSVVEFQDEELRDSYLSVAETQPSKLLIGEKPRLFDEWQDAPKIWGAIRKAIDDEHKLGQYILTGSSSKNVKTPHTGTLRISRMAMYPMSLYETKESNGTVSLQRLFSEPEKFDGCVSDLTIDDLIYAICRGGWPSALWIDDRNYRLDVAKELFKQTCEVDMSNLDGIKRDPSIVRTILKSYSRNICTMADNMTIIKDVNSTLPLSENAFYDYIDALKRLYIVDDVEAWRPAIRSKTAIRSSPKKNLIDPSIATAALDISEGFFNTDFKYLGFLFESLCIRDLKIYSSPSRGHISYYRDRYGLEADAVIHLENGKYAICEIKLGSNDIEKGANNLNKIESLIIEHNEEEDQVPIRVPDLKIVITGTKYGYRRDDGVLVIPIGCLRE